MFKQGEKFKRNQKKYKALIEKYHLNMISLNQLNIVNNLKSKRYACISEGFDGGAGMNAVEQKNLAEKTKIPAIIFGSHYIAKPIFDKFGFYN